jgi:hypothetical protein
MKESKLIVYLAILVLLFSFSLVSTSCGGDNNGGVQPPPASKPTISFSPTSVSVALGSSADIIIKTTGNPAPAVSCVLSGAGAIWLSGNVLTYSISEDEPLNWSAIPTCTATNSAGSASASISVTLQYPVPVITSITPETIFCGRECMQVVMVSGSGFYVGGKIFLDSTPVEISAGNFISHSQVGFYLVFDQPRYNPGHIKFTAASPAGHGGGTSNDSWLAFLGNLNTLAVSPTEAFQLDQADPNHPNGLGDPSGAIYKFRLSDGISDGSFPVGGLNYGIAVDDLTGFILETHSYLVDVLYDSGQGGGGFGNNEMVMAVAASNGYGCATEDLAGELFCFSLDLQERLLQFLLPIGNTPWPVAMETFTIDPGPGGAPPGSTTIAVVFNSEDLQLSFVKVPDMTFLGSTTLVGLTPMSQLAPARGGWQIAIFNSGVVALLHESDKTVVFAKLNADGTVGELRRVVLGGNPFRIVADNANSDLIVAFADTSAGLSRFSKISLSDGAVAPLQATWDKLATGFAVSADGTKLYVANRDQFRVLSNQ